MGLIYKLNAHLTRRTPAKLSPCRLERPVASITFDDFPRSAWTVGGPILERYRARATYYAAGRFRGVREEGIDYYDEADLVALQAAGHEVGAHSFAHQVTSTLSNGALKADAAANDEALQPFVPQRMSSYAYPYGVASPRTKWAMGARYACARGIDRGVNAGVVDLAQLRANPLEFRRWVPEEIDAAVEGALTHRGWVIFFTHDVDEAPSPFGCTPFMLDYALRRLDEAGIEVLPVRQAMARTVFGEG